MNPSIDWREAISVSFQNLLTLVYSKETVLLMIKNNTMHIPG